MSETMFWILLGNELVLVPAGLDDSLVKFFKGLRKDVTAARYIPTKISYDDCKFYQLQNPVRIVVDDNDPLDLDTADKFLDQVKQACLEETNRVLVNPIVTTIRWLATESSPNCVCLAVDIPDRSVDSISEGSEEFQDEDLGVFEADDIQNVLYQMNYKIEFIPWGHPQLAVIVNKTGDKHGYLKFVEREREVSILRYLTEINSPSNHTISGVQFWPVEGGTVISMPVAGGWLTSLDSPGKQLRSVALQLFDAVAFMHEHNVAHMDLKPQNVIIPAEGGRLTIIDFSVSIRVRRPDVKYSGPAGTEDYMAPEVRKGQYKPILADLWSCGRTLEELCGCCGSSADRTMLLEIATRLMDQDPEARPKMSTVLELLAPAEQGEDNVV